LEILTYNLSASPSTDVAGTAHMFELWTGARDMQADDGLTGKSGRRNASAAHVCKTGLEQHTAGLAT